MPDKTATARAAYTFLRGRATSGKAFSLDELSTASGWSLSSAKTYRSKMLRDLLEPAGRGKLRAKREVLRLSEETFVAHMTQVRPVFTEYSRTKYERLITYEFLLPLTREDKLRRSLDALFFTDTLKTRLGEIGLDKLETLIPRPAGTSDDKFLSILASEASRIGAGYSVAHTSGRFRAADLMSRREAGDLLAVDGRYLVDETTAIVRFIIPLHAGKVLYGKTFEQMAQALSILEDVDETALAAEVRKVRVLFFQLFVEAVVRTVQGEDEIWLIEESPTGRRLYTWTRS
jgi:hypothetical protein